MGEAEASCLANFVVIRVARLPLSPDLVVAPDSQAVGFAFEAIPQDPVPVEALSPSRARPWVTIFDALERQDVFLTAGVFDKATKGRATAFSWDIVASGFGR